MKFYIFCIFLLLIFSSSVSYSQKKGSQAQYFKILNADIKNDTIPNYILSLKNKLQKAQRSKKLQKISEYNLYLAVIYYRLNSTDKAIVYNLEALNGFEQLKDTSSLINTLSSLIRIYKYTENDSIALVYAKKALEFGKKKKNLRLLGRTYLNVSAIMMVSDKKKGLINLRKAISICEKAKDIDGLAVMYNNLAYYFYEINNPDSANYYYDKSLGLIKNKKKNTYTAVIYANKSKLEYDQNDFEKALEFSETALSYVDNIGAFSNIDDAFRILVKASIKTGNNKKAVKYFEDYLKNRQGNIAKRKVEQATKLKILYEVKELESEIKLQESRFWFVIAILVLTGFILIFIIRQNIKLKQSHRKIVEESIKSLKIEGKYTKLKKNSNEEVISSENNNKDEYAFFEEIKNVIENKELYKDSNLSLNSLSAILKTNRSYVSRAINNCTNKSFVEFINEYKVDEAKILLLSKESELLTLEAIGKKAGFNSKTTFFRVFKQISGVTPSFFMKNA